MEKKIYKKKSKKENYIKDYRQNGWFEMVYIPILLYKIKKEVYYGKLPLQKEK